jgi:hypothetical protein
VRAHRIVIAACVLVSGAVTAFAQTYGPGDQPVGSRGVSPFSNPSATGLPRPDPLNSNVANPYANTAPQHRNIRNPYFGEDNPYITSTATPRRKNTAVKQNPADTAAQQQSGLTGEDASTLFRQRGYTGVSDLHADPNSLWVWQADAVKNGRRVRLGIDNHGNLLELGASTQPCTSPGAGFGAGPLGTGARISDANRCLNR